jgi:hypothetical protein
MLGDREAWESSTKEESSFLQLDWNTLAALLTRNEVLFLLRRLVGPDSSLRRLAADRPDWDVWVRAFEAWLKFGVARDAVATTAIVQEFCGDDTTWSHAEIVCENIHSWLIQLTVALELDRTIAPPLLAAPPPPPPVIETTPEPVVADCDPIPAAAAASHPD